MADWMFCSKFFVYKCFLQLNTANTQISVAGEACKLLYNFFLKSETIKRVKQGNSAVRLAFENL